MFAAELEQSSNAGGEVYPSYPGLVLAEGKLITMVWGFPLRRRGRSGQPLKPKPINNTRDDKLDSPFWRASFTSRRCLIPMQAFAEAEGEKGRKMRTWIGIPGSDVFTCAGVWRDSAEWGRSYSLMMTNANDALNTVHDRMPVIIDAADRDRWLAASLEEARTLCKPYAGPLRIDRTEQAWSG